MTTPQQCLNQLTMKRLAFIRFLHQQGVDQSRLPEPVNFTSVLSFHDSVEHFLILAGEHLGAALSDHIKFLQYWGELGTKKLGSGGVDLSGKVAMDRLNRLRNAFKHVGSLPGDAAVEQCRGDVAAFFEENTPKVFGIAYDEINLASLIPQDETRTLVNEATSEWGSGRHTHAMSLLRDAYSVLFSGSPWSDRPKDSPLAFGPRIRHVMNKKKTAAVLYQPDHQKRRGVPPRGAEALGEQIAATTNSVVELQAAMQVVAIGIDYHKYHRFQMLTPGVFYSLAGTREVHDIPEYAPTREHFDYCRQFVITVALRLAEVEAHVPPPPWRTQRGAADGAVE
ncbi:hypothetical protein [Thermomonospora umbrina]|uniref:Uncharacterized protein n=1 Tax=Thermomonospora umbrina TaxID=111806 RepID=A0A3D9SXN1_9ACTN|nr:hypothetical protein [Thermomonospora umbrina]REF00318.1 hypothetical protein DFJ69_5849 [Thermomonospora umbrina]